MKATEQQVQSFNDQWEIGVRKLMIHLREKKTAMMDVLSRHDIRSVANWEQSFFVELAADALPKWVKEWYDLNKTETNIMEDEIMTQVDEAINGRKR